MPKFRKKPVEIEARQCRGKDDPRGLADWCGGEVVNAAKSPDFESAINIKTLEGTMMAVQDDWIIKGVNGEFYPCKPDIFEKTYSPLNFVGQELTWEQFNDPDRFRD